MINIPALIELQTRIERYICKRVRDVHLAQDLSQDVMLKLHAAPGAPEHPCGRLAWALRTARNRLIDHHRARGWRLNVALESDMPSPEPDRSEATELAGCITPMVRHLPDGYRQAIELSELQGHSQQDVADRLGLSLSGAKSRVQRGRQRLRQMLEACCRIETGHGGGIASFEPTARSLEFCGNDDSKKSCVHSGA